MAEHAWILENLEAYIAGGMEPSERDRFDKHTAECPSCAQALGEARNLEQTLEGLFTSARPAPGLEDRLILSLRKAPRRGFFRNPLIWQIAGCAAAAVLLVAVGALATGAIADGQLRDKALLRDAIAQFGASREPSQVAQQALGERGEREYFEKHAGQVRGDDGERPRNAAGEAERIPDANELAKESRQKTIDGLSLDSTLTTGLPAISQKSDLLDSVASSNGAAPPSPIMPSTPSVDFGYSRTQGGDVDSKKLGGVAIGSLGGGRPLNQPGGGLAGPGSGTTSPSGERATGTFDPYSTYRDERLAVPGGAPAPFTSLAIQAAPSGGAVATTPPATPTTPALQNYFKPHDWSVAVDKNEPGKAVHQPGKPALTAGVTGKDGDSKKSAEPAKPGQGLAVPPEPAPPRRVIIRSGDLEFEIESFDSAVATVTLLVRKIPGGFVATANSQKRPNGKVSGSVVVRVPPEQLDGLVLELRKELGKNGELKGQRIGSEDITKKYTDFESQLRAARAMEERLLQIIKTGKGEIKDLLLAEKELGEWRTKIERLEGELRYYSNLVSLSTLTITLSEKEITAPFAVVETERIQMAIEAEDVVKAQQQALAAIDEARGRVTKSELKQHAAGQLSALINFEIAPEKAGPIRDRFEQLGHRTRLDIDRLQETEGGTGKPLEVKTRRKETQFFLSLYNVANIAPRETVHLNLACVDAEAVYRTILARVEKAAGRVVTSNLNRQRSEQTTGTIQFEVKSAEADGVLLELKDQGEVIRLQVTENPDVQNVTRSKRGFLVTLLAMGMVVPRETSVIQLATRDVPAAYRTLQDAVNKAKGRILNANLNEQNKDNVTAELNFEVRRTEDAPVLTALAAAGDVISRNVVRAQDADNVVDSKVGLKVTLINLAQVRPRETYTLGIEVKDVDRTAAELTAQVAESKGRTVESHVDHLRDGRVSARLVFDVPLPVANGLAARFKEAGIVRVLKTTKNPQVPDSDLAIARLDVVLSNSELIVPSDEGIGAQTRTLLSKSFQAISLSLIWLLAGILFLLPWALVIYVIFRIVMRMRRRPEIAAPAA